MMRVGLTGGIGSGKSTVAGFFSDLQIPVYDSDKRARVLMNQDPDLRREIVVLLGEKAYDDGNLNRKWVASRVFPDPGLLQALNALVHPAVRTDFGHWCDSQKAPYVIQEAAILIENGAYRHLDRLILVTAPESIRIERVVKRDGTTSRQVRERMQNQWPDSEKVPLADFVIENTDLGKTRRQVERIHRELLHLSGKKPDSFC
jgi:dephospho-CoA kinase